VKVIRVQEVETYMIMEYSDSGKMSGSRSHCVVDDDSILFMGTKDECEDFMSESSLSDT
jgi:hypothetical protein